MAALLCALVSGSWCYFGPVKDEEGVEEKEELKTGEDEIEATTDEEKADCSFRPWRPFEVKFIVFSVQNI